MGKDIYVYEVNTDLLHRHIPGLLEGQKALSGLRAKVIQSPDSLCAPDYRQLKDFIYDQVSPEDIPKELEEIGLKSIWEIHPNYAAVVFMELLRDLMPGATEDDEPCLYVLSPGEMLRFANILMLYQELFEAHDDPGTARIADVPTDVRKYFTPPGRTLLEREIQSRKELGEEYSGKYFPHYFHFFMCIDPHVLKAHIMKGTAKAYLIEDSY